MIKQFEVTFGNRGYRKLYPEGVCIADIVRAENMALPFLCNGAGTCGKCRVKLSGPVTSPTIAERKHITDAELAQGVRLACQTHLSGPLKLEWDGADNSLDSLQAGFPEIERIDPFWGRLIVAKPVELNWESLAGELPSYFIPAIEVIRKLACFQTGQPELTVEYFNGQIIDIAYSPAKDAKLGVAADIGTTTLAAYLVDLEQGRILQTAAAYNPQAQYGADVISRIHHASEPDGLAQLHALIITAINRLIGELISRQKKTITDVIQLNLAGNSCMTHLLLRVNPAGLGRVPFEPVFKQMVRFDPAELGIGIHPQGQAFVLPGIGGFVGSDISAGVLACKLSPVRRELFIDIGTNGELILTGCGRMLACSTAAGPAFEGAALSCGMLAKPGAITDVVLDKDELKVITLDNEVPKGICGTGLIRAIVELLRNGLITESGRWADEIHHRYFDREQQRFYLFTNDRQPVYLTQQDIRNFQLAKGAIRSGVELLLKRLSIDPGDLEAIYLAGAFGTYLNPEDAVFLGLLPPVRVERIKAVGNTAGVGAVISLLSYTALTGLANTVRSIEHVELAEDPGFTEAFTEALLFNLK